LYQYITGTGADGTIDEMNVVNNDAKYSTGRLLYGYSLSALDRNYNKCVFINNKFTYFAYSIKIDFYYSIFDVNPTPVTYGTISQKDGCVVDKDNLETNDFVGKTCVKPYVPK
jgi:hypothetical protein